MIVMNVRLDNFYSFKNFHLNMSYPKKIVDSTVEGEFLKSRPNFRYKKINIIMGANATGKTTLGKVLMEIFYFMETKSFQDLTSKICDKGRDAFFSIDFVTDQPEKDRYIMNRIDTRITPAKSEQYQSSDIHMAIRSVYIGKKDRYETCAERIEAQEQVYNKSFEDELGKINGLSWLFVYPTNDRINTKLHGDEKRYLKVLEHTLKALDPSVHKVEKVPNVENSYIIRMMNRSVLMQDGKLTDPDYLSSGTKSGIEIAGVLSSIMEGNYRFYYCDEKFSYVHSDVEKAFLAVMVRCLNDGDQLFFTTHNSDILDMPFPKHSFTFLKHDTDEEEPIKCVSADQYLKRNTDSVRNAVDNDLFSSSPDVEMIYTIAEL